MSTSGGRRVVLVTGAARGIGRAVAEAFGAEGARVVINHPGEVDNAEATADRVRAAGGEPLLFEADVADPSAVERMADAVHDRWAGRRPREQRRDCPHATFFDIDVALWDRVHAVNLRGVFLVTQAVTRRMVEAGRPGRVVSISSISAWVGGSLQAHYCPTKAGVSSLMKSLAIILGRKGSHAMLCSPGVIETDINREESPPAR